MTVLVTGASGMLGAAIVDELHREGHSVRVLVRAPAKLRTQLPDLVGDLDVHTGDVTDPGVWDRVLPGVDAVIHTAAYFREYYEGRPDLDLLHATNVTAVAHLLDAGERHGIDTFVHISSTSVLAPGTIEHRADEDSAPHPDDGNRYRASKIAAEKLIVRYLGDGGRVRVPMILPAWMWGPRDAGPTSAGRLYENLAAHRLPLIPNAGTHIVDARDVAVAVVRALERGRSGSRYVMGGAWVALPDLARLVSEATGAPLPRTIPGGLAFALATGIEVAARLTRTEPATTREAVRVLVEGNRNRIDSARSTQELGVGFRSIADTINDIAAWHATPAVERTESPAMTTPTESGTGAATLVTRRVIAQRAGGPDVLEARDADLAPLAAGHVRVRVRTAGVAFGDVFVREGLRGALPATPGYDVAGVVTELGPGVDSPAVGANVVAWTGGIGGYAEDIDVPAWAALEHDPALDPAVAVTVVLNYLTARQLLTRVTRVADGDRVLVHGGGGGVGTALLQLAALSGVTVYATASAGKHDLIRTLGGIPIDYRREEFVGAVRAHQPGGLDAVYDPIGGGHLARSARLLRPGGTLVAYGFSAAINRHGRRSFPRLVGAYLGSPRPHPLRLFATSTAIAGYTSTEVVRARPDWYREDLAHILDLLRDGRIQPIIAETIPLDDAPRAHRLLTGTRPAGKIVLTTRHYHPTRQLNDTAGEAP